MTSHTEPEPSSSAMRRYYPGFIAALFIILLRIAIGWHFLNEGMEKYELTRHAGKEPFSAEIYLRNATGPLAHHFRGLLPDVDGRETLDLSKLKESWKAEVDRIAAHFRFTDEQRAEASKKLDAAERWANDWFMDPVNQEKRQKYFAELDALEKAEVNPGALSFENERGWDARRTLDADRRGMIAPINERAKDMRDAVAKLATGEQVQAAGAPLISRIRPAPYPDPDTDAKAIESAAAARPWTGLDWINLATTYGLIAIGACLILGFLTPLAAIGAAAFLAMIYLSMPPWPGMPPNPKAEGHYFIVSKNLVELIACLVIAATPSGHWIGLDALFFGFLRRRRLAAAATEPTDADSTRPTPDPQPLVPPRGKPDRDPIPIE